MSGSSTVFLVGPHPSFSSITNKHVQFKPSSPHYFSIDTGLNDRWKLCWVDLNPDFEPFKSSYAMWMMPFFFLQKTDILKNLCWELLLIAFWNRPCQINLLYPYSCWVLQRSLTENWGHMFLRTSQDRTSSSSRFCLYLHVCLLILFFIL